MARNLSRSTELYISTESGGIDSNDTTNLFEIKVLDGYSFSQDTTNVEIGINEAGSSPVRGTQAFNTALNPADVSFSTYVRVYENALDNQGASNDSSDCTERVLWGSAMGTLTGFEAAAGAADATLTVQDDLVMTMGLDSSNNNELMPLTLYFVLEGITYRIDNFTVATAEVDFSIDGIAAINWSGQGSLVSEDTDKTKLYFDTLDANVNYTAVPTTDANSFLRNKLSVLTLKQNVTDSSPEYANGTAESAGAADNLISFIDTMTFLVNEAALVLAGDTLFGGRIYNVDRDEYRTIIDLTSTETLTVDNAPDGSTAQTNGWVSGDECIIYSKLQDAPIVYDIPITGATVTLENNVTYLTPEELAIVNKPLAGFAGNRVVSGSLTAYLNTGAEGSGGLLADMLGKIEQSVSNNYQLIFKMGGDTTRRVEFFLPVCQLSVPTIGVEDVITTEISFISKPHTGATGEEEGSFEATNELTISHYDVS